MGILETLRRGAVENIAEADTTDLAEEVVTQHHTIELLTESIRELEDALREPGWDRLDATGAEFTRDAIVKVANRARVMWLANPLIQRAVNIRHYYVWGQGVQVAAADEDINAVIQAFMDDQSNQQALFGHQAREDKERALSLDGNLFFALFTNPISGRVQVRGLRLSEMGEPIVNPDDDLEVWYYPRQWTENRFDPLTGQRTQQVRKCFYPDFRYRPRLRPSNINGVEVRWDSPVMHIRVGGLDGMRFGVSEVYAAMPWARAYKEFLEDWAAIVKALSRYAFKAKTKGSKVPAMSRALEQAARTRRADSTEEAKAGTFVGDGQSDLTPMPKSGATVDASSGRPLAMMVATAMDVPYTILTGDIEIGNRATARTLDRPTELAMLNRQELWAEVYRALFNYVVDWSVKAMRGSLSGSVAWDRDLQREVVTLGDETDRTVAVDFPELLEHDIHELVKAIAEADGTEKLPPEVIARLLLVALQVEDIDEVMSELVDPETGEWRDPAVRAEANAGQQAVDAFRRGDDPAALLR